MSRLPKASECYWRIPSALAAPPRQNPELKAAVHELMRLHNDAGGDPNEPLNFSVKVIPHKTFFERLFS